jgi:uncharacterized protein (TIGR03437 family)
MFIHMICQIKHSPCLHVVSLLCVLLNVAAAQPLVDASSALLQTTPTWTRTGNLNLERTYHGVTLLPNGQVLLTGGSLNAELYNPATRAWTLTRDLNVPRISFTTTLLPNGKVLVAGGRSVLTFEFLRSAELYDPAANLWTLTGNLNTARSVLAATLLPNGKVLVAGGENGSGRLTSAELYDPATGVWTVTGSLNTARGGVHHATLLSNGQVLVSGRDSGSGAELYDPGTGVWTRTGDLNTGRIADTATLLPNGKVLVAGGTRSGVNFTEPLNTAELYDPATGTWTMTSNLNAPRYGHTATLLPNGKVLVTGGATNLNPNNFVNTAELYDPATGTWTPTTNLNVARGTHLATLLLNGQVLAATSALSPALTTAELYDSGTPPLANVSAASFALGTLAPNSITAVFGVNLAASIQAATTATLPTTLGGVSVRVRDKRGVERLAPLFFVAPGQINYLIPPETESGQAMVMVTNGDTLVAAGSAVIANVAPGLFAANANGQGVPAALTWRLRADDTRLWEPLARFDSATNRFVPTPIELGPESDQLFLILYGTGIRGRNALNAVTATIGGINSEVLFAGAVEGLAGLDQINARIPRSLAGRGEVEVALTVEGRATNVVRINIR